MITSILQVIALMEHGGHSIVVESGTASFILSDFFLLPFLLTINYDLFESLNSTVVGACSFLEVETVDHTLVQYLEM